jgi:hypothetical protein
MRRCQAGPDWRPADGQARQRSAIVQRGAFDQLGASHAICNVLYGAQAVRSHGCRVLQAIATTGSTEWLARDPGCAPRCVLMGARSRHEESDARGDVRFVSVLVLAQGSLLGPALLAGLSGGRETQLPIAIHAGSWYRGAPVRSAGLPIVTNIICEAQAFQPRCSSLI